MDPAALETRLAEARARRRQVLAERARDAEPERPSPPPDLPPDALRPLLSDGDGGVVGRAAVTDPKAAKAEKALGPLASRSTTPPDATAAAPSRVLRLVAAQERRPQPAPAAGGVDNLPAEAAPAAPTAPDGGRRRAGPLLLALVAGAVIGLASATLVPGLGGWQIVIVRPAAEGAVAVEPDAALRGSEITAGEGEAAADGAEAPPALPRLAVPRAAAVPRRALPPPQVVVPMPEALAAAAAPPEVPRPVEHAKGALPRIDGPGAPPQVRMIATPESAQHRAPPDTVAPVTAVRTPATLAAAGAPPELPRPVEQAGGALSRIDGPGALPQVRMTAAIMPEAGQRREPPGTVTPVDLGPAWQVPALDVPAVPPARRALPTLPAPPPPPPAPEPLLSRTTRAASIVLHHPPGAAEKAEAARGALAAAGADAVVLREVRLSISSPNVRYYHGEDRQPAGEVADLLAAALGGEVAARDFTGYEPAPDPGLIEIWIDGSAPTAAPAATPAAPRADTAGAARERLVRSLQERLRERLRSGQ